MEFSEFEKNIDNDLNYINIQISKENKEKLYEYMSFLINYNKKVNLTAIKDEKEIILKHFVDSIFIKNMIKGRVIDIGSGAGFPGIPLKIVNREISLCSIDSVGKKVNFQKELIKRLNINDIETIHIRAEDLADDLKYRENFDFVVSRAVANLTTLVEYMLPFVKVNGKCICLKGPNAEEEINNAKKAIKILGGEIEEVKEYKIAEDTTRTIIIISKKSNCSKEYPRKMGKPLKSPLE